MDRNRKRKATDAASPKVESSASKRQKTRLEHETPQTTTTIGLQFVDHLKSAKDKTGRLIADLFIDLPSKKELPDYYRTIKLPIAISTVQDKLERHEYPTLSTVESDIKRMVANAKQYNDDKSTVYQDAERIRKALSNFMTKHNPAYKDPNYIAIPTPIPGGDDDATASSAPPTRETSEQPKKITISLKASRDRKSSAAPPAASSPALAQDNSDPADFTGKTFQQAQEHIINGLISHTDQELDIFQPFVTLPPRTLTDYYNIIKKPTSLTSVRKRVRGQHSRGPATMQTDFKTWDAFEDEVSYIWRNARDYNEDGSDIFNLSIEFEQLFKERLAIAKKQVDEPTQPKIKLNAPRPKPVLHLGARGSPAPRSTPADDKKEETVTNSTTASSAAVSRSNSQVPATANATATTASSPVATTTAVKTEKSVAASPSLAAVRPQSIAPDAKQSPRPGTANSMLPPPVRAISGSPHPSMLPHVPHVPQYVPPPTFIDKFARSKPVSEALLPSLVITAHPQLNNPKPFRLDVPPSPKFTQQSITMAIPAAQYYISIIPTVSQRLLMQRQYKLFVTINNVRLMSTTRDFMSGGVADRKIVYDTALNAGVNRIEVEVVAVSGRNGALEMEKVTVFANLLK
ncbi:Bromodomain-containing protein, partial [Aureobasidium melanogenum]